MQKEAVPDAGFLMMPEQKEKEPMMKKKAAGKEISYAGEHEAEAAMKSA